MTIESLHPYDHTWSGQAHRRDPDTLSEALILTANVDVNLKTMILDEMTNDAEPSRVADDKELLEKIRDRSARIGVIGLGYVGLPLCVESARSGFEVHGFDVNDAIVDGLNRGTSHVLDIDSGEIQKLVNAGRFTATDDFRLLSSMHIIVICVPTPLNKTGDPDLSFVASATSAIVQNARIGQLIVLESTTYPGTTREIVCKALRDSGFHDGEDIFVAYSPERIDPGNREFGLRNTPKVVGGVNPISTTVASEFYLAFTDRVISVSDPETAEMTKLLENTFRSVNIALANEVSLMCELMEIDVWEVIEAASTKPFGFMPFFPGPGIGGHCIPLDPSYLAWKMRTLDYTARFIQLATEINTSMPAHVVDQVADRLNANGRSVQGSRILLIGMAYKPDIADIRESPSLDVAKLLARKGAALFFHDPHVPSVEVDELYLTSSELTPTLIRAADCVVILTAHFAVDYEMIRSNSTTVIDTRNALRMHLGAVD